VKNIDPLPVSREDGGIDYKDRSCGMVCYTRNGQGVSVRSCEFLQPIPSWPIDEFGCSMPDDG